MKAVRIIRSPKAMQSEALRLRRQGIRIGFVPTMGFLHEGHLSLCRQARRAVGPQGTVVLSLFVNPTQFGPREDLGRYPRNFAQDKALCKSEGVDILFCPTPQGMYPGRDTEDYSTYVVEENLSRGMEGSSRPTHFRGVTTVVAKLFNLVLPEIAVFGAKDYQQAAVIQRMTTDLNMPVKIKVAPTRREPDGLAMSSRNTYLNPSERKQALCLVEAIRRAKNLARTKGAPIRVSSAMTLLRKRIEQNPDAQIDYLSFFDPKTFKAVTHLRPGVHFALAVRVGSTRLIDNTRL